MSHPFEDGDGLLRWSRPVETLLHVGSETTFPDQVGGGGNLPKGRVNVESTLLRIKH
jgi:hypothetical protein